MKDDYEMNSCQKLNTLKQHDKPNLDIAKQASTDPLNQKCYKIDLDPSQPTKSLTKEIHSNKNTHKLDAKGKLNPTIENNKDKVEQIKNIEEIKSKNETLSSNCQKNLKSDKTVAYHRWGMKEDVKMFKALRQI